MTLGFRAMTNADVVEDVVTGSDGRTVGYLARGPRDGRPVVYLHGAPGSRREMHVLPDRVLDRFGVRAVSVDRAGYGATDPLAGPVTRVVLSSAQMPYDGDGALAALQPGQAEELPALRAGRSVALEQDYADARTELLADVVGGLAQPMATLTARERDWFAQQWARQVLVDDVEEAVRASYEGYLEDGLSSVRPFEVDVSAIRCPVRAVHGSADDWEPLANVERVLATLPDAQLFRLDGLNHFGPLLYPDLLVSLCVGDW